MKYLSRAFKLNAKENVFNTFRRQLSRVLSSNMGSKD